MTVKLMYCYSCKIHTNHHKTKSGDWVCWCGAVNETEAERQAREIEADSEWLGEG